ncbi:MAG: c-type cytochrome [Candidatus Melainabacteria bacterium]|nr:c-type cytochrome [Candidatus Melainabacteria bacterium]
MDIKVLEINKVRINFKAPGLILLAMLMVMMPVSAASRTGLSSSLITEWESEVDRSECPDFLYPSHNPSIITGKKVYQNNCAKCHGSFTDVDPQLVSYMRKRTPEKQFEAVCGGNHNFKVRLTIDERWDALMYMRTHILGYYPKGSDVGASMDSLFGGNCAICHGTRGQGDGNLHKMLYPPPANFNMFKRLYTRSDEKLFNEISYGIPWTAMPAWKDRHDFDRHQDFDEEMVWKLVRYVRSFAYSQELDRLDKGRQRLEEYKKSIGESN